MTMKSDRKIYMAFINMTTSEIYNLESYGSEIKRQLGVTSIFNKDGTVTQLYAWTLKKDLMKKFRKSRSKRFVYKRVSEDDVETTSLPIESRLLEKKLLSRFGEVKVVMTYAEDEAINDFTEYTLVDIFTNLNQTFYTEYMKYKGEYIDALDVLNYTYFTDILAGDEGSVEVAGYNSTFGMTPFGHSLIYNSDKLFTYELFMYAFRITMNFEKRSNEITRILLNRWGVSI